LGKDVLTTHKVEGSVLHYKLQTTVKGLEGGRKEEIFF